MRKRLFFTCALLALIVLAGTFGAGSAAAAPDLAGSWAGAVELPGAELEMIFHITPEADGMWSGTLDVPAQGAEGIPITEVKIEDGTVVFNVSLIAGVYSGSLSPDGLSLAGVWEQSGMKIPLTLEKAMENRLDRTVPRSLSRRILTGN